MKQHTPSLLKQSSETAEGEAEEKAGFMRINFSASISTVGRVPAWHFENYGPENA